MRRSVTRREFLEITAGSAMVSAVGPVAATRLTQRSRPNILFILCGRSGLRRSERLWPPRLPDAHPRSARPARDQVHERLLRSGRLHADACALLTGRYPQRLDVGLQEPLTRRSPATVGMPPGHPTVASLVRQNGYDTALIGKRHRVAAGVRSQPAWLRRVLRNPQRRGRLLHASVRGWSGGWNARR